MSIPEPMVRLTDEQIKHAHYLADKFLDQTGDTRRPRGARSAMRRLVRAQVAVAVYFRAAMPTCRETVVTRHGVLRVIVTSPTEPGLPMTFGESATELGYVVVIAHSDAEHEITHDLVFTLSPASAVCDGTRLADGPAQ
jgi:hypothetical protein